MTMKEADRFAVIGRVMAAELSQAGAAMQLQLSLRQVKRLCKAVRDGGAVALISKKRGRPSNRRIATGERERIMGLVRQHYPDFGPELAGEYLRAEHGFKASTETLRGWMIADGLWHAKLRRAKRVHSPRERRACLGELVQIDGSHHAWFEQRGPKSCLTAFIDDATGRVLGARFTPTETTQAYFDVLHQCIQDHGVPLALYSDRHSIFTKHDPEDAKPTQFERALLQLRIEPIQARSPQAKGRVERLFQTLQDRMCKALRLSAISNIEAANEWLVQYIAIHNQKFAVLPRDNQDAHRAWSEQLQGIRNTVTARPDLCEFSRQHAEYGGKNQCRFFWHLFKPRRAEVLRILSKLPLVATNQDAGVEQALAFVLANRHRHHEWIALTAADSARLTLANLAWIPEKWWKLVTGETQRNVAPTRINRRQFEVCFCAQMVRELKSGDVCVTGSDAYSDHRDELVPMEECERTRADYGEKVGIPVNSTAFVTHVRTLLTQAAQQADQGYLANPHFNIVDGRPKLDRYQKKALPTGFKELDDALRRKLDRLELSLLDVLADTMQWLGWGKHFGPLSGHQGKLHDEDRRKILTVFAYGTGIGPTQIAKNIADVSARQVSFVNQRQVTTEKLEAAISTAINGYNQFQLPQYWGDTKLAAADGTQWNLYENNLLSERHIRYGGYGGIACYHVSDTYIALFSHFIPCGVWEAVYILDGLTKNTSDIQPDILHGDTQAQSAPVYGLAFLLGIKLMPRIRNWKDLKWFRPASDTTYEHIDDLFSKDVIDWDLIACHLPDMLQVAQSIQAGRISPSTILRKLGTASRKNKLYFAFRELGRAVRTMFLLEYIGDQELRQTIQAAQNKCEGFNNFAQWAYFGSDTIEDNVRENQLKIIKYNHLVANLLIFHNCHTMTQAFKDLEAEGMQLTPELLAAFSPYRTHHANRFGMYELRDRTLGPIDYGATFKV